MKNKLHNSNSSDSGINPYSDVTVNNQFVNAVARIRFKELELLGKTDIESLMSCKNEKECLQYLTDKGWGKEGDQTSEQILASEREKTWELLKVG